MAMDLFTMKRAKSRKFKGNKKVSVIAADIEDDPDEV